MKNSLPKRKPGKTGEEGEKTFNPKEIKKKGRALGGNKESTERTEVGNQEIYPGRKERISRRSPKASLEMKATNDVKDGKGKKLT